MSTSFWVILATEHTQMIHQLFKRCIVRFVFLKQSIEAESQMMLTFFNVFNTRRIENTFLLESQPPDEKHPQMLDDDESNN